MEIRTDALLLRGVDYGENDKMVTLFTVERGKIGASMKGVKKATAKLKFASQPFCFAEYVLSEKNGRYTVTSASLYDGFYPLREDISAFYGAATVVEACDALLYEGMVNTEYFLATVRAISELSQGGGHIALIKYLLKALAFAGYPISADNCPACEKELRGRMRFDLNSGAFFCDECGIGTPASESTYQTIRHCLGKTGEVMEGGEKRALRLLKAYFEAQTEKELSSLGEYIRMM